MKVLVQMEEKDAVMLERLLNSYAAMMASTSIYHIAEVSEILRKGIAIARSNERKTSNAYDGGKSLPLESVN